MAKKKDHGFVPDKHGFVPDSEAAPAEPSGIQAAAQSGAAKFLAPMFGGGLGAVGGTAGGAALGTMIAPGPGTIVGGVLGGMLGAGGGTAGAEAGRQTLAGEQINPQELMKQGGIAAATEPLGMAIGPGIAGMKAMGGAGAMGNLGKRFLAGASKEIEERFPGALAKIEQVGVGNKGIRETEKMLTQTVGLHRTAVQAASAAGIKAAPMDLMQPVMEVIAKLDEAGSPAAEMVRQRANKFFEALGPRSNQLPAMRVLRIKQAAQDATDRLYETQGARRAAGKMVKRVGGKTAELNFQEALAKGSQVWLENNVPGSAVLNQETRALMGAKRALQSSASKSARRGAARVMTAATTAALPGGIGLRMGAGALGYAAGHMAEPLTTPILGAGLDAMQNPIMQQLLRQAPRGAGLGFNQAVQDQ